MKLKQQQHGNQVSCAAAAQTLVLEHLYPFVSSLAGVVRLFKSPIRTTATCYIKHECYYRPVLLICSFIH